MQMHLVTTALVVVAAVQAAFAAFPAFPPLRIHGAAGGYSSSTAAPPEPAAMVYSDNGVVKVGADLNRGGMSVCSEH